MTCTIGILPLPVQLHQEAKELAAACHGATQRGSADGTGATHVVLAKAATFRLLEAVR